MPDEYLDYEELIAEANALLGPAQASHAQPAKVRLRLARDELSTKILKVKLTEDAERLAGKELTEAIVQLRQEIEAARRAAPGAHYTDRAG